MLHEKSYTHDIAAAIDTEQEIIADEFGVSLETAQRIIEHKDDACRKSQADVLASIIGLLIQSKNMPVMVHSLAIAFGMNDSLDGAKSQSEIAKKLGVTRALISHYVVGWRDIIAGEIGGFDCTYFRKKQSTRMVYAEKATSKILQIKQKKLNERLKLKRISPPP